MARKLLSKKEINGIKRALIKGESVTSIAKKFGRSKGSVSRIVKKYNIKVDRTRTEKATRIKKDYNSTARIKLFNLAFNRALQLLSDKSNLLSAGDLQKVSLAIAILTDKRRLEDQGSNKSKGAIREMIERLNGTSKG